MICVSLIQNQMNPAMFQTGFYPMPKQNQRAFFPPAMTQMRQWGQPSMKRPYNVPVQQRRGRGNKPCASISGMGARTTNPSTRHTGIQKSYKLAQNQDVQKQQAAAAAAAAKLKFNANARNQPEAIVAGSHGVVVCGDRAQGMQVYDDIITNSVHDRICENVYSYSSHIQFIKFVRNDSLTIHIYSYLHTYVKFQHVCICTCGTYKCSSNLHSTDVNLNNLLIHHRCKYVLNLKCHVFTIYKFFCTRFYEPLNEKIRCLNYACFTTLHCYSSYPYIYIDHY